MAWPTAEQQHFRVIRMNQIHRTHPQRRRNRLKHPQADRIPLRHAVQQRAVIYLSRIRQGTFRKPILLTGNLIQRPVPAHASKQPVAPQVQRRGCSISIAM